MQHGTRICAAGLVAALASASLVTEAVAQEKKTSGSSVGSYGIVPIAIRRNLGALGADYGWGFAFGVYAGIEDRVSDTKWSVGLALTTLFRGWYVASKSSLVEDLPGFTEGSLGVTLSRHITPRTAFFATGGATLFVSNVPLPTSSRYLGGYGGVGFEFPIAGQWAGQGEIRLNHFIGGPDNLTFMFRFVAGR